MKRKILFQLALGLLCMGTSTAQLSYLSNNCKSGNDTDDFTRNIVTDAAGNHYATIDYNFSSPVHTQSWLYANSVTSGYNFFQPYNSANVTQNTNAASVIQYGTNIYVVGSFDDQSSFDINGFNSTVQTSQGGTDIFLAKYDMVGQLAWAKVIGGTTNDAVTGFAIVNNHVYLAGHFGDTLHVNNTTELVSNGGNDMFVARFDTAGTLVWARSIGGSADDMDAVLEVNAAENIYLAGRFSSPSLTLQSMGSPGSLFASGASNYMLLASYNSGGVYNWSRYIGTGGAAVYAKDIVLHSGGDVIIGGYFTGSADFDPGTGTNNLTSNGGQDIFMARFNNSGDGVWANNIGGSGDDAALGMAKDTTNRIFVTGYFNSTVDFDPASGTSAATTHGGKDFYIARYNADGSHSFSYGLGGPNDDIGTCIAFFAPTSTLYVGGGIGSDDADFNPGILNGAPNQYVSNSDAFIAKYSTAGPLSVGENEVEMLTIYPNPATDVVNIALPLNAGTTTLKVYNMQGQLIMQKQLTATYVDVAELSNGLYTLTLENDKGIIGRSRLMIAR